MFRLSRAFGLASLPVLFSLLFATGALAAPVLRVQRLVSPEDAARMTPRQRAGVSVMTREEAAQHAARLARWRSVPHEISRGSIRWSPYAQAKARQKGWGSLRRSVRDGAASATDLGPPVTLKVALIRIDFQTDRGGAASTGDGKFDVSGPDTLQPPIDRPPHDSLFFARHLEALARYYHQQSYGRVILETSVWPRSKNGAYHCTDLADFGPWKFSRDVYPQARDMFRAFAVAADTQSIALADRIPWDDIDGVIFMHAGSDLQSDVRQDSPEDLPTFTVTLADTDAVVFRPDPADTSHHPKPLQKAEFMPELNSQDGYFGAMNGTIAHESGHLLFDFDDVYNITSGFPVVGFWSLMDSGNLVGTRVQLSDGSIIFATGLLPPSVDPYQRIFTTDTLAFREASIGDTIAIQDQEHHPDMRALSLTGDEFLILENRFVPPDTLVALEQDSITRIVMGPRLPTPEDYDVLLPGGGILVWHIDESHIWFSEYPVRLNQDYGINTDPNHLGISVIEGDGLQDLGDPGSPFPLGSYRDPFYLSNNATLSDTTHPNLLPNLLTRPHRRLDFLDDPSHTMHFTLRSTWQLPGWPVRADRSLEGRQLLAIDADGDRSLEVCWAGGDTASADSAALFAVRADGTRLDTTVATYAFAHLDRRPRPIMAALALNDPGGGAPAVGPSWFAVSTYAAGPDTTTPGGRVWLIDHHGNPLPGWPAALPSIVTTPPVVAGLYPNAVVVVGCANGNVYAVGLDGTVLGSASLPSGAISGRLAVTGSVTSPTTFLVTVAAGSSTGYVGQLLLCNPCPVSLALPPLLLGGPGFSPDFLWIPFDGANGRTTAPTCGSGNALVVHDGTKLWALCASGSVLWARDAGDTLVASLGAGDPDGDGFPDVLTQSIHAALAYWNVGGYPKSGWPKRGSSENFVTHSPPLAIDLTSDGKTDVVALNASGILAALDGEGHVPPGWPLASGADCLGSPVAADLNGDGRLDVIVPDRDSTIWAYTLPTSGGGPVATSWTMVGGDPGRTSWLRPERATTAPAPFAGPLQRGSLRAFPNPARRHDVSFSYILTEPADVEVRIFDTSGHQVTEMTGPGVYGVENRLVWNPASLPAGLYMARVRIRGAGGEHTEVVPVGILR